MMSNADDSDENHESSSHPLPDLLADLTFVQQSSNNRLANPQLPWQQTTNVSRPSSNWNGARPTALLHRRTSSNRPTSHAASDLDIVGQAGPSNSQVPALFTNPNRSIFSSGPPTASVSANTAHASMSALPTPSSSNPLSALNTPSIVSAKRPTLQQADLAGSSRRTRFIGVKKDVDDPSSEIEETARSRRRQNNTPTTLSNLFAPPEPTSPTISRHGSYIRTPSGTQYVKAMPLDTAPLPNHLYTQGLLSGRHSDITIHAFNARYPLHRLLLDRAPFFRSAFSEPWHESTAKEITLHPEDIDANITKTAFELALKRIYGCGTQEEEDREATALFATGCWLEMTDLVESSVNSILKQMTPANISKSIQLATSNYYGKHGNRILAAAKAMLCREGWEMPLRYFDGIAGEIIREIIGCDGFYVPTEWNRYITAKRILNRRLKAAAIEAGLVNIRAEPIVPMPDSMKFMTVRFDAVYRQNFATAIGNAGTESDRWLAVYTTNDIAPLLVLLDEGIHYIHMSFEQLQRIRESRDILGLPLLPEKVISNALWASMELRQHIVNATENELELGLAHEVEDHNIQDTEENMIDGLVESFEKSMSDRAIGKLKEDSEDDDDEMDSGSWDGNGKPRKFWIPVADATFPLGGDLEPVAPTSPPITNHRTRISASIDPSDLQWATDFGSSAQERPQTPVVVGNSPSPEVSYTHYPPFRFAVEFPPARSLKINKRVYSSTVWYAGSLWNVYVQKKETNKGTQLGIYLHRERQVDGNGELLANILHNSVNERISHIEREALLGRSGRRNGSDQVYGNDDSSESAENTLSNAVASADLDTLSGMLRQATNGVATKASEASLTPDTTHRFGTETPRTEDEREDARANERKYRVSTLPPYVDARPTIRTYFKIYTPSKGGRVLSVYESAPDKFNFSQSWGWKSSNLVLDDASTDDEGGHSKEPRLRFMVVIGNV